jgi:hypothetical protein
MSNINNLPTPEDPPEEKPGMSQPSSAPEAVSPPPVRPPLARHRRQRRRLIPSSADQRAEFLEELAHRAYPTLEFFIFSLLSGAVLGASYLLDSQALLFLGILLAPLMTPWIGMVLATVTGSWRFFFQTFIGFLFGAVLIFVTGLLAGFASLIFMPITLNQAFIHTRLWWPDLFVLLLGAILLPISIVRSEDKPILPSAMLAYEFYLPLSAAAVGLGSGVKGLYPDGLVIFLIHVTLATLVGIITLFILGFRPYTLAGFTLGTTISLIAIVTLIFISGLWTIISTQLAPRFELTPSPSVIITDSMATSTLSTPPLSESSPTPVPPTDTPTATPTATLVFPTPETPTATPSPMPTPIYAKIFTSKGNGVIVRTEPSGSILATLVNGFLVEVLPEQQEYNRTVWAHIRFTTRDGTQEGWVIQSLLITATPAPNWQPTLTPSP